MSGVQSTPFGLTICGLEELPGHCLPGVVPGVTHVLSLLDPGWPEPEAIREFDLERRLRLHFHDIIEPVPGWVAPERWDVELLLAFGRKLDAASVRDAEEGGAHLLVHCHAGVSRSTASAVLLLAQCQPARSARDILAQVIRLRPQAWPNLRLLELGDALLGRDGEIVEAARLLYRLALAREPGLAAAMISAGRGREVAVAGL